MYSLEIEMTDENPSESVVRAELYKMSTDDDDDDDAAIGEVLSPGMRDTPLEQKRRRRVSDVIDSIGDREIVLAPGHSTPQRSKPRKQDLESPDQGYSATPESANIFLPEWLLKPGDVNDASPRNAETEIEEKSTSRGITGIMPVLEDAERYNMSHKNRGKCLVFNHEVFDTGFDNREGSTVDAKRIEQTFARLGFDVTVHDNFKHSDVIDAITKLSKEDHSDNDCVCIFMLTHGLNNDLICAKDVAYKSDNIWKPFTADKCLSLAGKPKLFFFQACRGDRLDSGVTLTARMGTTQTDSAMASYTIPTHADFFIAHSTVEGFYSWRNPEEGTWYVQCLCDVFDKHAATMDLARMLMLTARKVATEYATFNDLNPAKDGQKQVPSTTTMLIREVYLTPK